MLYGADVFLENSLGVRWFQPGKIGEVVPRHKELSVPRMAHFETPGKRQYRFLHYCLYSRQMPTKSRQLEVLDWIARQKYNVELERVKPLSLLSEFYADHGGCIPLNREYGGGHNFQRKLLPPKQYFKDHPEYYPYNAATGKRVWQRAQLCTTDPGVVKTISDKAIEYFKKHPDRKYFGIYQEDGSRQWCECENCKKLDPAGQVPGQNAVMTNRNLYLVNAVARNVRKQFPDKFICTYAYSVTMSPPDKLKPEPNVVINFCPSVEQGIVDNPYAAKWLAEWAKMPGRIWYYNYPYMDFQYNFSSLATIPQDMRYCQENGFSGARNETAEAWGLNGIHYYLASRLLWDPELDAKLLLKDYYAKFYGKAAKPMERFQNIFEQVMTKQRQALHVRFKSYPRFTPEQFREMADCLDQAKQLDSDPLVRKRLTRQKLVLEYLKLFQAALVAHRKFLDDKSAANAKTAIAAYEKIQDFLVKNRRLEIVSRYKDRIVKSQIDNINRELETALQTGKLLKKYDKISNLPLTWNFRLDPENVGEKQRWYSERISGKDWKKIKIGKHWENQGVNYDGMAWYRTAIRIPKLLAGRKIVLYFMAVDEKAWVYVNGKFAGGHYEGDIGKLWTEPFAIDITRFVKPGETCDIAVKVHDSSAAGGIWKPVYLLAEK